ncbi:MAG: hypothetical protein ACTSWK_00195 [Promethearchaeota archaeon]
MANKEEQYKMILYTDLVYFLLSDILIDKSNKKELAEKILEDWELRNKKLINEHFKSQAANIISKDKNLIKQKDEISILLSVKELVFDCIRKDFAKELKKEVLTSFEPHEGVSR